MRRLVRDVARVGRGLARAPLAWRAREWTIAVALAAALGAALLEKRWLQDSLQGGGDGVAGAVASAANVAGSGLAVTCAGLVALAIGRLGRRTALVDTALALGAAGVWCWLLTKAGQLVLAERRPVDGGAFRLFALDGHGVSGHAAAAALLVELVRYAPVRAAGGRVRRLAWVAALLWAALVGWSRVWLGMHFVWNVLLGYAIGAWVGSVAAKELRPDAPVSGGRSPPTEGS